MEPAVFSFTKSDNSVYREAEAERNKQFIQCCQIWTLFFWLQIQSDFTVLPQCLGSLLNLNFPSFENKQNKINLVRVGLNQVTESAFYLLEAMFTDLWWGWH